MSQSMTEWEAAWAANLNLWDWDRGAYPGEFKEKVLAWHSRHVGLEMHRQDAVARAPKKK